MSMFEEPTIPCKTCGRPTTMMGTGLCHNCWEVESRLGEYLKAPKAMEFLRGCMPKLDDWMDEWDYEAVLTKHKVVVPELGVDENLTTVIKGYQLVWKHGFIHVPTSNVKHARKAAALFIELWLRGISASFADNLMDGYLFYLEALEK